MIQRFAAIGLGIFLSLSGGVRAADPPAGKPLSVAAFEDSAAAPAAAGCAAAFDTTAPAAGRGCLRVVPAGGAAGWTIRLPFRFDAALPHAGWAGALTAQVRLPEGVEGRFRWLAVDARRAPAVLQYQRVFTVRGTGGWQAMSWPLPTWRWGDVRSGDWSEADTLVLRGETPVSSLGLDEVALLPGMEGARSALPDEAWLLALAFGAAERRVERDAADGLLAATDAMEMTADDLRRRLAQARTARAWLRSAAGAAFRPPAEGPPVVLLVFRDGEAQGRFLSRLGEAWGAQIAPAGAGGYTVGTFATSTWDARKGADRPVYLHEFIHALVARDLRLPIEGKAAHWIQEGLANYAQLGVYPASLDRQVYVKHFACPVDPDGRSFFVPLAVLAGERVPSARYAQAASLAAYLAEEAPPLLEAVARGLADGGSLESVLKTQGLGVDELQKRWLAWGAKAFAPGAPPEKPGAIFRGYPSSEP
jgi:hypothetical protein